MNKKVISMKDIDLKELKNLLNRGDMVEIAKRTNYTPNYVRMCLNPNNKSTNKAILKEALNLVEEGAFVELESNLAESLVA